MWPGAFSAPGYFFSLRARCKAYVAVEHGRAGCSPAFPDPLRPSNSRPGLGCGISCRVRKMIPALDCRWYKAFCFMHYSTNAFPLITVALHVDKIFGLRLSALAGPWDGTVQACSTHSCAEVLRL